MHILGINAFHADASACLLTDGRTVAAIAEERLGARHKHHAGFPARAVRSVLETGGVDIADVNCLAVDHDPRAHLASSYYNSPFREAAGFSYDASGDFVSGAYARCDGDIDVIDRVSLPHSLGYFYTAICQLHDSEAAPNHLGRDVGHMLADARRIGNVDLGHDHEDGLPVARIAASRLHRLEIGISDSTSACTDRKSIGTSVPYRSAGGSTVPIPVQPGCGCCLSYGR